jgi:hypothetical protein
MQEYEFRFQDRLKVTVHVEVHAHPDDLSALERARRLSSTHAIEVWDDNRFVVRVKKGDRALTTDDRASL